VEYRMLVLPSKFDDCVSVSRTVTCRSAFDFLVLGWELKLIIQKSGNLLVGTYVERRPRSNIEEVLEILKLRFILEPHLFTLLRINENPTPRCTNEWVHQFHGVEELREQILLAQVALLDDS
jgi:hypothetical protein